MTYYFGDWLKEQRKARGLTQSELSKKTNNKITQSTISMWERKEITIPSLPNILSLTESLDISFRSIPWDYFKISTNEEGRKECEIVKERFGLYDLPKANSVRTFEGKTYDLFGSVGIEKKTGEVRHVTDLYYRTKTVVSESKVLAKRKSINDELETVNGEEKKRMKNKKVKPVI